MAATASTDDTLRQVAAADTTDQLDALQATTSDPAILQAIQIRRDELAGQRTKRPTEKTADLGQNAKTEPDNPKEHYFEVSNGDGTFRHVNAWGEEKGSPEDRKRW